MALLIGNIEPFNPDKHEFADYSERMEQFMLINCVKENMKVPMLITLIGPDTYNVLKNLVSPAKPSEKTYTEIMDALSLHYTVRKSAVAGRYEFYKCKQKEGQTVNDFIVEIKKKAAICNFGMFLKEALRDRLVCGLSNEQLIKKLLTVGDNLSFEEAVKVATIYESAEKETRSIQPDTEVHVVGHKQIHKQVYRGTGQRKFNTFAQGYPHETKSGKSNGQPGECRCCGGNHPWEKCHKKAWTCYNCHRQGHMAAMCRFRPKEKNLRRVEEQVSEQQDQEEEEIILGSIQHITGEEESAWMPL